jgi:sulfite reductase (NADPH) hemoprotein beta-component
MYVHMYVCHLPYHRPNTYIQDLGDYKIKTALREIAEMHTGGEITLTANQNLIIGAVPAARKPQIESLLSKWNINNGRYSAMRLHSMACVALPTCALAMAEAQTYLPKLITKIEEVLDNCGLRHNAITIRMTGCPNGCARPYLGEIAFVGKAPGMYNMYLGAGFSGNRINKMYREGVTEEQILAILTPMLQQYSREMKQGEHFGDWVIRAGIIEPTLNGHSFWDTGPENDLKTPSGTNQIYW